MAERYLLSGRTLPVMPVPHDCVIENIEVTEEYIVFRFENGIHDRPAVKIVHPGARSLVIKYRLADPCFYVYRQEEPTVRGRMPGYKFVEQEELPGTAKGWSYLCHYVGYNAIIIKLWRGRSNLFIDARVDEAEYDWIEG